jgi:hypothetical protein
MGQLGMIKLLSNGVRRALGSLPPGWSLNILPDDVFLVSFPKSGNTWARFLLGNLISPDKPATFSNIRGLVPDPLGTPTKVFDRMQRPRIIKSHECFDPRYPRVIYMVRDPRDVVVSQYHYHRKIREIADDMPIEAFVSQFLAGKTWPCGSWGQHVVTWLGTSEGDSRFLLLRYEDMLVDTSRELRKIVEFIGLQTSEKQIALAVERSTAGRMREVEQAESEGCDRMIGRESRKDIMFVRAAGSGGWRKDLPMPMVQRIEAAWGRMMRHLGYGLVTQAVSEERDYASIGIEFRPRVGRTAELKDLFS